MEIKSTQQTQDDSARIAAQELASAARAALAAAAQIATQQQVLCHFLSLLMVMCLFSLFIFWICLQAVLEGARASLAARETELAAAALALTQQQARLSGWV